MNIIYSVAILMLAVIVFAMMLDAVISVSRKPSWIDEAKDTARLTVIDGIDRREGLLPFVGAERRKGSVVVSDIRKAA